MLNPIFWKKVQGQKHPGRWGIVKHQIPSIKVLFKTNTKSHKHPGIKLLSSESKTQLVNQRKQKVAFNPGTAHSPEIQSYTNVNAFLFTFLGPLSWRHRGHGSCFSKNTLVHYQGCRCHDYMLRTSSAIISDNRVHGANMGPIWGRHGPGGPHVGPMNLAIWVDDYLGRTRPYLPLFHDEGFQLLAPSQCVMII